MTWAPTTTTGLEAHRGNRVGEVGAQPVRRPFSCALRFSPLSENPDASEELPATLEACAVLPLASRCPGELRPSSGCSFPHLKLSLAPANSGSAPRLLPACCLVSGAPSPAPLAVRRS